MKKIIVLLLVTSISCKNFSQVRVVIGGSRVGYGMGRAMRPHPNRNQNIRRNVDSVKFKPVMHFTIGYAFPNLDKSYLLNNNNSSYFAGTATQQGPLNFGVDYQFSKTSSLGLMASKGFVSVPFYGSATQQVPDYTTDLGNWAIMINYTNYFDTKSKAFKPYLKTAFGVNIWNQNTYDNNNNKLNLNYNLPDFAYQISIGTKINVNPNAGFFIEAGFGKYILNGGVNFRF